MSDDPRMARRKPAKYFIANKGSESDESDNDVPAQSHVYSPPYHGHNAPYTTNGTHYPHIVTKDFAPRHPQDISNYPSLSSPSSASSHAGDGSTPPPATPGSTLPPASSPPIPIKPPHPASDPPPLVDHPNNSYDGVSSSRPRAYPPFARTAQRSQPDPNSVRRPRTSPVVSTSELYQPSSFSSSSSALLNLEGLLICVSTDAEPSRLNVIPLSGVQTVANVRECILRKSKLPDNDLAQYAIYRTEIGETALGEPLSDDKLHELIRTQADSRGSLKFFLSRYPNPQRDLLSHTPPALTIDQTLPPPVIGPLRLNMKRHHSRSRQGSTSSVTSEHPAELGYDADGESQKPNHRQLPSHVAHSNPLPPSPRRRPGQALPMQPPPLPHSVVNGQPPSPVSLNHHFKPPTPPMTSADRSPLPVAPLVNLTYTDKFGQIRPMPGPPPPLSPRRSDAVEDLNLSAPFRAHQRSGSDAGAERDLLLKKSEQQMDSYTAQWRNKEPAPTSTFTRHPRETLVPRRKQSIVDEDAASRDSWVHVDGTNYPHDPNTSTRDPPRASPTTLSRSPRGANPRYFTRVPNSGQSKSSTSATNSGPESRPSANSRSASKALPMSVMVAWKGEEYRHRSGSSGSKGLGGKSMTKSMDNLRLSTGRRNAPPASYQSSRPSPMSGFLPPSVPAVPKINEQSPRTLRPLPVQGSPHPSTTDFTSGSSSSITHVSQYPRSTAYPSSTTTSTFMSQTPDPIPRPLSAADSPIMSPTYRNRPLNSPTYGPTLNPGESARSPRAVSPHRTALTGPRPQPPHSNHSDRSTSTSTPPRTPISPTSPQYSSSLETRTFVVEHPFPSNDNTTYISASHSSDSTLRQDDNERFQELLKSVNYNAQMSRDNLHSGVADISIAVDDNSSSEEEGDGGTWKVLPRPPSVRPELAPLQTEHLSQDSSGQTTAEQLQHQPFPSTSNRPAAPQSRPSTSRRPTETSGNNVQHRFSTFGDDEPRPPPEKLYDHLEAYFPGHDLDKPVIEANSGGNSPTSAEPVAPLPPPPLSVAQHTIHAQGGRLRSTKKSIRLVAEEHKRKINDDRYSRAEPLQHDAVAALRKRNTKMWGSRLEEVNTQQVRSVSTSSAAESPSGGPTTFKWVRGELIGKGTYGKVYLALNATTGEMIAVKQVELPQTPSDKNDNRQATVVQALKMESETLKDLDHPHIVQYLGFEETPTNLSIFLEYVPGGSIGSVLHRHGKFDENVVKSFTFQILDGLEYLHSKGILHRDLKADNILVEMTGTCKISDFGISKRTDDIYGGAFTAMQGTVFWMAPEVINTQKGGYNFKIDIWSVGCVVLEMWGGRRPWTGQEMIAVMFTLYQAKLPPPVPDDVTLSQLADDFRLKCFAINPDERPSAAELKKHHYLQLPDNWQFKGFTSSSYEPNGI